jgi:hypothetical protein
MVLLTKGICAGRIVHNKEDLERAENGRECREVKESVQQCRFTGAVERMAGVNTRSSASESVGC